MACVNPGHRTFKRRMENTYMKHRIPKLALAVLLLMTAVFATSLTSTSPASATCASPTQQSTQFIPLNKVVSANKANSGQIYSGPINYSETSWPIVRAGGGSLSAYSYAGLPNNLPYFSVGQAYDYDPYDLGDIYQVWQTNLEFDTSQIPSWRTITSVYIELDYAYDWSPNAFFIEARPTNYLTHGPGAWVPGASITSSAPSAFSKFGQTTGCTVTMIGDLTDFINRGGVSKFNLTPSGFAANVPPRNGDGVVGFTDARLVVNYSVSDFFP